MSRRLVQQLLELIIDHIRYDLISLICRAKPTLKVALLILKQRLDMFPSGRGASFLLKLHVSDVDRTEVQTRLGGSLK